MSKNDKPKKNKAEERIRKIGQREEMFEYVLTQVQIEDLTHTVMDLLDQEEQVKEKLNEVKKNYASQLETIQLQRNELRRTIKSGRRRESLIIEEHLTASNEVIRIRQDTGEPIGRRTATQKELQEDLPFEEDPAPQSDASPEPSAPDGLDGEEFGAPAP